MTCRDPEGVPLRVLLVTGAYFPEISAAAVQCRAVAAALGGRVRFSVLTTAGVDSKLRPIDCVDGVAVHRVIVDVQSLRSKAGASAGFALRMLHALRSCDVVHVHGFSQKNVPTSVMARLLRKPLVLTLHTAGQDEPQVIRQQGRLRSWAFESADLLLCVSPLLEMRCRDAGLPEQRVRLTPNGVDTSRFRPADRHERLAIRRKLGWPGAQPVVLFVGFFSRDKRPELLFQAWRRVREAGVRSLLVYVGATGSGYYEIDRSLAGRIREKAAGLGCPDDVVFMEPTSEIEDCFRAADAFVLPSVREAHPLALIEAMACAVPAVVTRLPGVTDVVIDDGGNGRLFAVDDERELADILHTILSDPDAACAMGARARETILAQFDIRNTAERWLAAYRTVLDAHS